MPGARVSFMTYDYPLIEDPITYKNLDVASLIDIGCMKMSAIMHRGAKKDFIDLYFILQELVLINKKLEDQINYQINRELYSEYLYLSMASYLEDKGLAGMANFMVVQAEEERFHAMKFHSL